MEASSLFSVLITSWSIIFSESLINQLGFALANKIATPGLVGLGHYEKYRGNTISFGGCKPFSRCILF
jgi:hypothetical protein